jgi:hypothetical protein
MAESAIFGWVISATMMEAQPDAQPQRKGRFDRDLKDFLESCGLDSYANAFTSGMVLG